ncbi:MAG: CPBP family intramembrane glutamic endopeptidase [Saprospiraceae bacterium]
MDYMQEDPELPAEDRIAPKQILFFLGATVFLFMLLGTGILALVCNLQGVDMQEILAAFNAESPLELRNFVRGALLINHLTSFLLPALLTGWVFYRKKWPENLQVHRAPGFQTLALALLFIAAAFPLAQKAFELNRWIVEQIPALQSWMATETASEGMIEGLLVMESPWELLFSLLVMALVPAIGEEMIFRGLLQKNLLRWLGKPVPAILITALIFSLAHFQVQRFLAIFMLGAALGCLFFWTKNLWIPIAAHFMNNGVQVVVAWANQDKLSELNKAEEADIPVVVTLLSLAVVLAIGYYFWKKSKGAPHKDGEEGHHDMG